MIEKHNIQPVYDKNSKILILGSFPSVKSRKEEFFYAHPQNRFWKVLSEIFNEPLPQTIQEKKAFLLNNNIAVWDVIESCNIENSSDSSIKSVTPNDISKIIKESQIATIFTNGSKSYELYNKYTRDSVNIQAIPLPSTSPANAKCKLEDLYTKWNIIKKYIFQNNT